MKDKLVILLIFLLLFFYITGFLVFNIPVIFLYITGFIGFYLITGELQKTISIFSIKELLIIAVIFIINLVFLQRLSIWDVDNKNFLKSISYSLQHIIILYSIAFYGLKNLSNAIIITKIFSFLLLASFVFFGIGVLFPESFVQLRYIL